MSYITSKELSEKWGISQRRIIRLAQEGRIEGAKLYGKSWIFPEDARKPSDGRTAEGKKEKEQIDDFRYPIFEYRDPDSFVPPLNKEELQIRDATEAFYACRFEEANLILGDLPERTKNKYSRISALYVGCMTDIFICRKERFLSRYGRLLSELQGDFPHKKEMTEYLRELYATLGEENYYSSEFCIDPCYRYHESALPRLVNLSAVHLLFENKRLSAADLKAHEINCFFLEKTDFYHDLQALHIYLGVAYGMLGMVTETDYHVKKAFELAEKYDMYYAVCGQYYYMRKFFKRSLEDFSDAFKKKLISLSDDINRRFVCFMEDLSMSSIYCLMTPDDFIFLYYAAQGFSNKEVASRLNISVSSVGKRYGDIYALLGVSGKEKLVQLYKSSIEVEIQV